MKTLPVFFAALILSAAAFSAAVGAESQPPRAMWIWNTPPLIAGGAAQTDLFNFMAAPKGVPGNAINVLFFCGAGGPDLSNPTIVKNTRLFLRAAHARHIRVDYLCGDPHWVLPADMSQAIDYINTMLDFNKAGAPDERYDGISYDVEPYGLPGWPSPAIQQGYLDMLDKTNAAIKASGEKLILSAAIPRWFDQEKENFIDRGIIDRTDEVEIMDYVQNSQSLLQDPYGEITYSDKVGKKVWIGVETGNVTDDPGCTFYALGNADMESVLSAALPMFEHASSFAGYAIHHYDSYVTLKP